MSYLRLAVANKSAVELKEALSILSVECQNEVSLFYGFFVFFIFFFLQALGSIFTN